MGRIISSRTDTLATHIQNLQEIVTAISLGTVGDMAAEGNTAQVQIGDTLPELVRQVDILGVTLLETLEMTAEMLMRAQEDLATVSSERDIAQDALANLIGGIDYDEAMDHATADLMDCFCSSGAADVSADGELVFDARVTFTKEDLKPMLREAIVRWVELKLAQ